MEQLFEKYKNIQKFLTEYRKFVLDKKDSFLNFDDFKNKIQLTGYVIHHLIQASDSTTLDIYLFKKDSKYIKTTSEFIKLLDRYRDPIHIMIFTKERLSIYLKKAIRRYPNIRIENYLHKHFMMELNKGPLCAKHTILSLEEAREVCIDLMAHGHKLPAIAIDDPQNIWIGGKINDIIKIEANSEITGKTIRYRIVTPISGKIEQSTSIKKIEVPKKEITDEKEVIEEEEDYVEDYEDYDEDYEA
jgi:DNA-directed RNA polymerase subunit H (RpoH/RPB5)